MATGEMGKVLRQIRVVFEAGTATGLTDRELVERFTASRDSSGELAFTTLVERRADGAARLRTVLRNHQDAQDAFQATFLILAKAGSLWVRDSAALGSTRWPAGSPSVPGQPQPGDVATTPRPR